MIVTSRDEQTLKRNRSSRSGHESPAGLALTPRLAGVHGGIMTLDLRPCCFRIIRC